MFLAKGNSDFRVSKCRRRKEEVQEAEGEREIKYCLSKFIVPISDFQGRKGGSVEV